MRLAPKTPGRHDMGARLSANNWPPVRSLGWIQVRSVICWIGKRHCSERRKESDARRPRNRWSSSPPARRCSESSSKTISMLHVKSSTQHVASKVSRSYLQNATYQLRTIDCLELVIKQCSDYASVHEAWGSALGCPLLCGSGIRYLPQAHIPILCALSSV